MARTETLEGVSRAGYKVELKARLIRFRMEDGSLIDPFSYQFQPKALLDLMQSGKAWNVRKDYDPTELIEVIRANGVPGTMVFYKDFEVDSKTSEKREVLVVIEGHRRTIACVFLLSEGVEVHSVRFDVDDSKSDIERTIVMLNSARNKPLTMLERADAVKRLQQLGMTNVEIARRIPSEKGDSTVTAANVGQLATLANATPRTRELIEKDLIKPSLVIDRIKAHNSADKAESELLPLAEAIEQESQASTDMTAEHKRKRITQKTIEAASAKVKKPSREEMIENLRSIDFNELDDKVIDRLWKMLCTSK